MPRVTNSYEVGEKLLGPIMADFFENMYSFLVQYDPENTVVFFMARGGLGIRCLFEEYLICTKRDIKLVFKDFYASRIAIAKGCYVKNTESIIEYMVRQFNGVTYQEMIEAICKHISITDEWLEKREIVTLEGFKKIINEDNEVGSALREYLKQQSEYFESYIEDLSQGKENIILVDTGWLGTSQENLMRAYPNKSWIGCYFGKWDYYNTEPWYFEKVHGVAINKSCYNRKNVRAGILFYHHLIESPLEPIIPSTEEYIYEKAGVRPNVILSKELNQYMKNDFYRGINYYIQAKKSDISVEEAYKSLVKMIVFPNKRDVQILKVGRRGADFGRSLEVAVVHESIQERGFKIRERITNVRHAIWKQGQMVYEFPYIYRIMQVLYFLLIYNKPIKP